MKDLRVIVLAAGKGTRMKSEVPKVAHFVCGRPMIRYVLDIAAALGSLKTYVVLGHRSVKVKEILSGDLTVVQQPSLLGTADAVKRVRPYFRNYRGDVLILCGDTPLLEKATVRRIVQRHKKTKAVCTFLTAAVRQPKGYGRVIRDGNGAAVAIREDKDLSGCERDLAEINVGVYCCQSKDLFKALQAINLNAKKKEFYLTDMVEYFSGRGFKIETVETDCPSEGLGINTREDLAAAEAVLRKRITRDFMGRGVTITDPATTYIDARVKIGGDTVIYPFTVIEQGARIGRNCRIGPFARIRPGTVIGDKAEIGNFAEISRTRVGSKTLMKHFGYLGDSWVGAGVNIGAGAVTANFDGQRKNATKIDDGAFIGSDSIFVAPVKVGKNAVIGAGSVVTKGKIIPDGCMAVGVPAKIISKKKRL